MQIFDNSETIPQGTLSSRQDKMIGTVPESSLFVPIIDIPSQSYGTGQDTLDASRALRNAPQGGLYFAGNVSYNSTGLKTVSGVGFKPKLVNIHASISSASSDGYGNGTSEFCRYTLYGGTVTVGTTSYSAYLSSSGNVVVCTTITPTSDGFTINVVNDSAGAFNIIYECFG